MYKVTIRFKSGEEEEFVGERADPNPDPMSNRIILFREAGGYRFYNFDLVESVIMSSLEVNSHEEK